MHPLSHQNSCDIVEDRQIGPKVQLDNDRINKMIKYQSSQDMIVSSLFQASNNEIDYIEVAPTPNQQRTEKNNRMARRMLTRKNKQEVSQKLIDNQVFKTLAKDRLVKQFKRTLFMRSYVMSQEYKGTIQNHFKYEQNGSKRVEFNSRQQDKQIYLIPGSKVTLILDLWSLIIKIVCLWMSPLIVSFVQDYYYCNWFELFIMVQIFVEVFIQINRPLNIQGETITNQKRIFQDYLLHHLLEDIIDIGAWITQYLNFNYKINGIACFVIIIISFKKMMKNYANCIETMFLKGSFNYALDIFTLTVTIITFAHIMACIFHYVGTISISTGECWLLKQGINDSPEWIRYNYSLYWAITTMVTVGYGDITAQNQYEMFSVSIMMLFSSGMFAYLMNSIGMILKTNYDSWQKYKQILILINNYMKKGQLNQALQNRVRNYVKHYLLTESNENFDEVKEIVNHLPNKLRQELSMGIQMNIMKNISVLNHNFSQTILKQLSSKIEQIKCIPDEIIYNSGDQEDQYLYYLQDGEILLCEEMSNKIIQIVKVGETFGEFQFFTGFPTKTQAISRGHSQVFRIHRNSLIKLFNSISNKDFQRFHNIKDNIVFLNNYQVILKKCNICNMYNHANIECPLISYQPDKFRIVMKPDKNDNQVMTRQKYKRLGDKINSVAMNNKVIESVEEYAETMSHVDAHEEQVNKPSNQMATQDKPNTSKLIIDLRQPSKDFFNLEKQKSNSNAITKDNTARKSRLSIGGLSNLIKKKLMNNKELNHQQSKQSFKYAKQSSFKPQSQFLTKDDLGGNNNTEKENVATINFLQPNTTKEFQQLEYLYDSPNQINLAIDQHFSYQGYMPNDNLLQAIKRYDKNNRMKNSKVWNPYRNSGGSGGAIFNSMDQSIVVSK